MSDPSQLTRRLLVAFVFREGYIAVLDASIPEANAIVVKSANSPRLADLRTYCP